MASPAPPSELQAFEEIYRAAGIKGPRLGYSIGKVIEMLQSEHIRNLATETKRASLLMALDTAGVQVDEVLQDATLRQRAINSYEAIQRKHLEEYEARKAQENCAIQAEMERVAAEYSARISNNLEEVTREKDSFRKWQLKKQNEAQHIAEAVALLRDADRSQGSVRSHVRLSRASQRRRSRVRKPRIKNYGNCDWNCRRVHGVHQ